LEFLVYYFKVLDKKPALKTLLILLILGGLIGGAYYLAQRKQAPTPSSPKTERGVGMDETQEERADIEVVAENLEIPWEIAFLPNEEYLITERPGNLLKIGKDRQVIPIEGVTHIGEGGLLGLALHPNFQQNSYIYLYLTSQSGGRLINRVERYKLNGTSLSDRQVIIDEILGAQYHDGGRIEFSPDGYLFITTGDAGNENIAQDTSSLSGKILRVNDDGSIPEGNPFGNAVYSYGHRNPQGLTWDNQGRLWATEHGRSGIRSGYDELNYIEMGKNYGWPIIQGDETKDGMERPIIHSGANTTWAPAGAEFINGSIFFAGLRGATLYEAVLGNTTVTRLRTHFENEYGRLRAVRLGPDGYLYIATSNQDGRGSVNEGDDKLIRINPDIFR
jgi:glucose/arabinose dehydrogenase